MKEKLLGKAKVTRLENDIFYSYCFFDEGYNWHSLK